MFKGYFSTVLLMMATLLVPSPATSTVMFDFDDVAPSSRQSAGGPQIEVYMEGLYGSNVTVSQKTSAVRGASILDPADLDNSYLQLGKGKRAQAIVIHFDDDPIDSFSIDFKLFKKAKNFSIYADGELISLDALSKAEKKKGMSGQKTIFFDTPVHTLEFVGKKKSFAIDNLVVDLPEEEETSAGIILQQQNPTLPSDTNSTENGTGPNFIPNNETNRAIESQVAAVPEPSSLVLLAFGFAAARMRTFLSKRQS